MNFCDDFFIIFKAPYKDGDIMKHQYFYLSFSIILMLFIQTQLDQNIWFKNHIVKSVNTNRKVIALTFDDGPHPKATVKILDALREKHVHATFFILGENINHSPQLLAQELKDGHEIGNHGYSHKYLNQMSGNAVKKEITETEKIITKIVPKPVVFRPPGGFYNKEVLETALTLGYTTILWTIDPRDWAHTPTQKIVDNVLANAKPGIIILLHDGLYPLFTPEAIKYIIDGLQQQGYEFVTVSELLQLAGQNKVNHPYHIYEW
jgi:polysaccharide deacetylase family sporulation protein PdaB